MIPAIERLQLFFNHNRTGNVGPLETTLFKFPVVSQEEVVNTRLKAFGSLKLDHLFLPEITRPKSSYPHSSRVVMGDRLLQLESQY